MNRRRDSERLLADVLADGNAGELREALLVETLGLVRQRRRSRQAWRAVCALAMAAGLSVLLWPRQPPSAVMLGQTDRPYALVLSQPLPVSKIISTQPFPASSVLISEKSVEVVQTTSSGLKPYDINDAELFALLGSKPVALVRRAPHLAQLIFVNEEDEEELFRN